MSLVILTIIFSIHHFQTINITLILIAFLAMTLPSIIISIQALYVKTTGPSHLN